MDNIVSLYTDGGIIGRNPSFLGGTWCCILANSYGTAVRMGSGVVTPKDVGLLQVTNNLTELLAAVMGLESLPDGWAGDVYTDSLITLCRINKAKAFAKVKLKNIPQDLRDRLRTVLERLGNYTVHLLGGHPTRDELAAGMRSNGRRVHRLNVLCDQECSRLSMEFQERVTRNGQTETRRPTPASQESPPGD